MSFDFDEVRRKKSNKMRTVHVLVYHIFHQPSNKNVFPISINRFQTYELQRVGDVQNGRLKHFFWTKKFRWESFKLRKGFRLHKDGNFEKQHKEINVEKDEKYITKMESISSKMFLWKFSSSSQRCFESPLKSRNRLFSFTVFFDWRGERKIWRT